MARRQEIAQIYDRAFADVPAITPLAVQPDRAHAYHLYVVQLNLAMVSVDRTQIFADLRAAGIGVNVHYIPVHLHPFYQDRFGTPPGCVQWQRRRTRRS
ncbi:MAG: DegT/DnrJ/EryC1/StrS family aminotransferase [Caldilineaceae bacterium]